MIKGNKKIEDITLQLLKEIGENPEREGLLKTPKRVAKAWEFISKGYKQDIEDIINDFEDGFRAAAKPRLVANK